MTFVDDHNELSTVDDSDVYRCVAVVNYEDEQCDPLLYAEEEEHAV